MSSDDASSSSGGGQVSAEQLLAQLAAVQAGNSNGLSSDALTQAILDRLNSEVARMYAEASADDGNNDQNDDNNNDKSPTKSVQSAYNDSIHGGGQPLSSTAAFQRPRPIDLWKAAHEVDRAPKEKVVMTQSAWEELVARLSESGTRKEISLLQAQHKQLKDQLAGLSFTPHISEKSRKLAELNKALPDRVAALMRKKKAKLDKIRTERAEKELQEATFRPNLNKSKTPVDGMVRKIGHLMQYEMDRRVRAEQRRAIIQEQEARDLVFQPKINKNSARIVARLKAEAENEVLPPSPGPRSEKKKLVDTIANNNNKPGRSNLPGHEQETFRPQINEKSRSLHRPGIDDVDVYTRLFTKGAGSKSPRGSTNNSVLNDSANIDNDNDNEEGPGHARYFNTVAYDNTGKQDFILRRLLSGASNTSYE